jgi:hypothetical protein
LSLRDITARSVDDCRTPFGGSTSRPFGPMIFCFYSLANGQLMVRESGPFVRYSSKH